MRLAGVHRARSSKSSPRKVTGARRSFLLLSRNTHHEPLFSPGVVGTCFPADLGIGTFPAHPEQLMNICKTLPAFSDGDLDPDGAVAFRDHLATCHACQQDLL